MLLLLLAAGLFTAASGHHGHEDAEHGDEEHACAACALTPVEPPTVRTPRLAPERTYEIAAPAPAPRLDAPRRRLAAPRGPPSANS